MILVHIGTNVSMTAERIDPNTTLISVIEQYIPQYNQAVIALDGSSLATEDYEKTFAEMGVTDECFLMGTIKTANA